MSKKARIILNVILGLVLVGCIVGLVFWSIHCWELDHNMFLKEYNAQMDKFGYYKSDIHLFDQRVEEARYLWCLMGNVFSWGSILTVVLINLVWGCLKKSDVVCY